MSDETSGIPADQLQLLRAAGVEGVSHDSHVPFLAHLAGVRRLLQRWGAPPPLPDIGLFHSVYGTEYFDPELGEGPSREEVRARIGSHAERVVWLWCRTRRRSIEAALGQEAPVLEHRDGSAVPVRPEELRDLVELWCADACEQCRRLDEEQSDFSHGLERVLSLASPAARAAVEEELRLRSAARD